MGDLTDRLKYVGRRATPYALAIALGLAAFYLFTRKDEDSIYIDVPQQTLERSSDDAGYGKKEVVPLVRKEDPVDSGADSENVNKTIDDKVDGVSWIGGVKDGWQGGKAPSSAEDNRGFGTPSCVSVDRYGNLYVVDEDHHRISRWDSSGNAQGWVGSGNSGWQMDGKSVSGKGYQSFDSPCGVAVGRYGDFYIVDSNNNRVCKCDSLGNVVGWIGGGSDGWKTTKAPACSSDARSFDVPLGICLDNQENIYVADTSNSRICKWSSSGNFIGWIGGGKDGWQTDEGGMGGMDYQSFMFPQGVCVDNNGDIYVADFSNHRICNWDSSGKAKGWIGGGKDGWQKGEAPASEGSDYRSFNLPRGVCVYGVYIYVADTKNHRISRWNVLGRAMGWIGGGYEDWQKGSGASSGTGSLSFNEPSSVFVIPGGVIYVADSKNRRVFQRQD
ncbi:NHL repeat-containing protein [Nanoarchaeota archaeon]